ncbi:hypothetical protein [Paraburkholderia phenoliruptrix]|uniref:hypothetical protein n=1 Tax=Paraburkholderia phenoliruptrix TaxID=252970 RepID=UPI00286401F8|nr:hypothetical protein [Paraburkholderia phenoliruptrix]MDR6393063.1 hypothetical protein [Paraburkholderia phenoliruptrix]
MADLASQFLADAGATGASAPQGLAAQFLADAAAPVPASAAGGSGTPQKTAAGQLGRQVGLTARAGATGLTALPAMLGDAANTGINLVSHGINSIFDTHIPDLQMPSQVIQRGENAAGLPQPANATERIVQDAASGMAGVAPSLGAAKLISGAASPVAQAVGRALQTAPGMQIMGAAGAGAGSSGARELGLSTPWQYLGAILGGAAGVGAGSAATAGVRAIANRMAPAEVVPPGAAAARADAGVDQAINELGPQARMGLTPEPSMVGPVDPSNPAAMMSPTKQAVAQAIEQNPGLSAAAALRNQDFQLLGIKPTLGQITRDPTQYAQELNMRGVSGIGEPLANRFNQQNTQLQQALYGLAGNAADAYQAGSAIKGSLKSIDNQMSQQVSDAYAAARASSGKNLDVPLTGLAQDYAQVLNDFGDKVPSGVRNNFNQLGLMGGTQQKTFTIENAENLLKVINANQSNDPATNAALGTLRNSVKNAILSADDKGGVYAPARAMAAQRFALQDQIPALEAAAADTVNPDDFVRKFVVGGKTDQVVALANLLKAQDPGAFTEARNQLGAQLALKGFGNNVAGDAPFKPAGFAQQMQAFGPTKLGAFYTPDELAQLNAIGRVGSYMNSFPSAAPVNTSNTASAIGSLVGSGVKKIPYVGGLIENAQNRALVNRALAARLSDASQQPVNSAAQNALGVMLLNQAPRTPNGNR